MGSAPQRVPELQPRLGELEEHREAAAPRVLWARVVALVAALVLAFLVGRVSAGDPSAGEAAELRGELSRAEARIRQLEAAAPGRAPGIASDADEDPNAAGEDAGDATEAGAGTAEEGDGPTSERAGNDAAEAADRTEPTGAAGRRNLGERAQTYVVRSGDTLVGIAESVYGDPGFADEIARLNDIQSVEGLRVGRKLRLPAGR